MKVFKFDPTTGKVGELIGNKRRASWAAGTPKNLNYGAVKLPKNNATHQYTLHTDAGIGHGDDEVSYRDDNNWTAFCLGEWCVGPGAGVWEWVILPPKQEK